MKAHALKATLGSSSVIFDSVHQPSQFVEWRRGGVVIDHAGRELEALTVVLLGIVVVVLLLEESLFVVKENMVILLDENKICMTFGNHRGSCLIAAAYRTFNIKLIRSLLDINIYAVGIVGKPLLGLLHLLGRNGEHFETSR